LDGELALVAPQRRLRLEELGEGGAVLGADEVEDRAAYELVRSVAREVGHASVHEADASALVEEPDRFVGRLDDGPVALVRRRPLPLGEAPRRARRRVPKHALDGGTEAGESPLHDEVVGAGVEGGHRGVLANRPGDDEHGEVGRDCLARRDGVEPGHRRERIICDEDIPPGGELSAQRGDRLDAGVLYAIIGAEGVQQKIGVIGRVLDQ